MTIFEAQVLKAAKTETAYFVAKHLEPKVKAQPHIIGKALHSLWMQGHIFRHKHRSQHGWYYLTTPTKTFESYAEYQQRINTYTGKF